MKAYIISLFSVLLLFGASCKKPDAVVSIDIRIKVLNAQGQDILTAPVVYDKNNIIVSHIINGQKEIYSEANANSHKGFRFMDGGAGLNILLVYPTLTSENTSTTLIQFGTLPPDTIKCEFTRNGNSTYCNKVWLNGELKFSDVPQTNTIPRELTLVK